MKQNENLEWIQKTEQLQEQLDMLKDTFARSMDFLLMLMDEYPDCIVITDSASRTIVYQNTAASLFFPAPPVPRDGCILPCPLLNQISSPSAFTLSAPLDIPCCKGRTILRIRSFLLDWDGLPAYVHIFADAASLSESDSPEEDCRDTLTQLYNRSYCYLTLEDWSYSFSPFTVCFLNIDDLNEVNQRFGHADGDAYICTVAEQVKRHLMPEEHFCRLGGDEFVLLSPSPRQQELIQLMEKTRQELAELSVNYPLSFSYGVIEVDPESGMTPDEILQYVSSLMLEYKQNTKKK